LYNKGVDFVGRTLEVYKESNMSFTFPNNFLWGTATAAHQVEGNNTNSESWVLEHTPGTMYAEPSGDACDHYHRYPQDIKLLADLGFNTYRFSLEWARIEPEEGQFSNAILDHYRRMLETCHAHKLTPVVTFHHFTSPRWLMKYGAWENTDTAARFARYCEHATKHLGDLIPIACTINEPNLGLLLSNIGISIDNLRKAPWWSEAAKALKTTPETLAPFQYLSSKKSTETFIAAHKQGQAAIKGVRSKIQTGMTLALQDIQAGPGGEALAAKKKQEINGVFLDALRGDDFVGVQTYSRMRFGENGPLPSEDSVPVTQMGYEFYPEALENTIRYTVEKTGCPVIVTENGLGSTDDKERILYIQRALKGVENCLKDSLEVRGYLYWSAFDNFEWSMGYHPQFGLIKVDRTTQKRTIKESAHYLGRIARANGLEE
jgi:beta-glucosidase